MKQSGMRLADVRAARPGIERGIGIAHVKNLVCQTGGSLFPVREAKSHG